MNVGVIARQSSDIFGT